MHNIHIKRRNYGTAAVLRGNDCIGLALSRPRGWQFLPATDAPAFRFIQARHYLDLTRLARALQPRVVA